MRPEVVARPRGAATAEHDDAIRRRRDWNREAALAVFAAVVVVAAVVYFTMGRHQWFFLDEWDFLASRRAGSVDDLFRPHNEHWSTLPILVYRALWQLVGLRSYRPYQALTIGLHLTLGVLLRIVMRRSGVDPWVATGAASLFVLLGSGSQDIVWAFQIGYVGAVVFGVVHLLLAVHDGPVDRRDWLGLTAGLAALMCSGVAVSMVVAVGVAVLISRGWRLALLHTVPLGVVYLAWLAAFGHAGYENHHTTRSEFAAFIRGAISATFRGLGQLDGIAIALGIMLVAGIVLALVDSRHRTQRRRRLAMPVALLCGAGVYLAMSAVGRPNTVFTHEASRYIDVTAALTMPAIAVAADALVRRWRILLPGVLALFITAVPGNIHALRVHGFVDRGAPFFVLALPSLPIAREVPRATRPDPLLAKEVTIGWLLDGVASGRIRPRPPSNPGFRAELTLLLALDQRTRDSSSSPCRVVRTTTTIRLVAGQALIFRGGTLQVSAADFPGTAGRTFSPEKGNTIVARATVPVAIAPAKGVRVAICD